ncbi:hypothetical protein X748_23155 [Mesorhizobium sp. LNJC386A00]|nr:hypothetical protein X748_23155 [Mesorhizobium sp. LNJC386A00]
MILLSLLRHFRWQAQVPESLDLGREELVNKGLSRPFELRLLAPSACLPRNSVETMVRGFAFG